MTSALAEEDRILREKNTTDLLRLQVEIADELNRRGIARTQNNLTGELGEFIFVKAFDWQVAENSQKSYDAIGDGQRFQIKARRQSRSGGTRQLGAIRDLDGFDVLAAVIFDRYYQVELAGLIPSEVVRQRATYVEHTNSWRFMFEDSVMQEPGVIDVTDRLRSLRY